MWRGNRRPAHDANYRKWCELEKIPYIRISTIRSYAAHVLFNWPDAIAAIDDKAREQINSLQKQHHRRPVPITNWNFVLEYLPQEVGFSVAQGLLEIAFRFKLRIECRGEPQVAKVLITETKCFDGSAEPFSCGDMMGAVFSLPGLKKFGCVLTLSNGDQYKGDGYSGFKPPQFEFVRDHFLRNPTAFQKLIPGVR